MQPIGYLPRREAGMGVSLGGTDGLGMPSPVHGRVQARRDGGVSDEPIAVTLVLRPSRCRGSATSRRTCAATRASRSQRQRS